MCRGEKDQHVTEASETIWRVSSQLMRSCHMVFTVLCQDFCIITSLERTLQSCVQKVHKHTTRCGRDVAATDVMCSSSCHISRGNHHSGYLLWDSSTSLQWTFVLSNTVAQNWLTCSPHSLKACFVWLHLAFQKSSRNLKGCCVFKGNACGTDECRIPFMFWLLTAVGEPVFARGLMGALFDRFV